MQAIERCFYSFQSNPIVEVLAGTATKLMPLAVAISAFLIAGFYFRFAKVWRSRHPHSEEKTNAVTVFLNAGPVLGLASLYFFNCNKQLVTFAITSCLSILLYPFVTNRASKVFANLFSLTILFSVLLTVSRGFIIYFCLGPILGAIMFDEEIELRHKIRKYISIILVPTIYIGYLVSVVPASNSRSMIGGFIGAFAALIYE